MSAYLRVLGDELRAGLASATAPRPRCASSSPACGRSRASSSSTSPLRARLSRARVDRLRGHRRQHRAGAAARRPARGERWELGSGIALARGDPRRAARGGLAAGPRRRSRTRLSCLTRGGGPEGAAAADGGAPRLQEAAHRAAPAQGRRRRASARPPGGAPTTDPGRRCRSASPAVPRSGDYWLEPARARRARGAVRARALAPARTAAPCPGRWRASSSAASSRSRSTACPTTCSRCARLLDGAAKARPAISTRLAALCAEPADRARTSRAGRAGLRARAPGDARRRRRAITWRRSGVDARMQSCASSRRTCARCCATWSAATSTRTSSGSPTSCCRAEAGPSRPRTPADPRGPQAKLRRREGARRKAEPVLESWDEVRSDPVDREATAGGSTTPPEPSSS